MNRKAEIPEEVSAKYEGILGSGSFEILAKNGYTDYVEHVKKLFTISEDEFKDRVRNFFLYQMTYTGVDPNDAEKIEAAMKDGIEVASTYYLKCLIEEIQKKPTDVQSASES